MKWKVIDNTGATLGTPVRPFIPSINEHLLWAGVLYLIIDIVHLDNEILADVKVVVQKV